MAHSAKALDVQIDTPKAKKVVKAIQSALETKCAQILQSATQSKEEIETILASLRDKSVLMNQKWSEELSKNFLPKFHLNSSSTPTTL